MFKDMPGGANLFESIISEDFLILGPDLCEENCSDLGVFTWVHAILDQNTLSCSLTNAAFACLYLYMFPQS